MFELNLEFEQIVYILLIISNQWLQIVFFFSRSINRRIKWIHTEKKLTESSLAAKI